MSSGKSDMGTLWERLHSEWEHQCVSWLCQQAKAKVHGPQQSLKSKPYFELKAHFNQIQLLRSWHLWVGVGGNCPRGDPDIPGGARALPC